MISIENYNENSFSVNGNLFSKVYQMKIGSDDRSVTIVNIYDSSDVICHDVNVNQIEFLNIALPVNPDPTARDYMIVFENFKNNNQLKQ